MKEYNILRYVQILGFVPGRSVTAKQYHIIRIPFG